MQPAENERLQVLDWRAGVTSIEHGGGGKNRASQHSCTLGDQGGSERLRAGVFRRAVRQSTDTVEKPRAALSWAAREGADREMGSERGRDGRDPCRGQTAEAVARTIFSSRRVVD